MQYLDPSTGNPAGEPFELASKADLDALVSFLITHNFRFVTSNVNSPGPRAQLLLLHNIVGNS